jgi:hypothetical protein
MDLVKNDVYTLHEKIRHQVGSFSEKYYWVFQLGSLSLNGQNFDNVVYLSI